MTPEDMRHASVYLRENRELWDALDIDDGSGLEASPLAQGEHNANYIFTHPGTRQRYVLRFNYISQLGLARQSEYEFHVLEELAPSRCAPRPFYVDESRRLSPRGVLVMEFVEGEMLDFYDGAALAQAARMLADVHSVEPTEDTALLQPPDALTDLVQECERMFAVYLAGGLVDPMVISFVERFFDATREAIARAGRPSQRRHIISTEMVSAHFIMPADGSGTEPGASGAPVTGADVDFADPEECVACCGHIVDWEKAIVGEATRDVAYFLAPTTTIWDSDFIFTADARDAFVERYWDAVAGRFSRDGFDERFTAYTMANCLRGVTWSAQAFVHYRNPVHPLKNEKTARKLDVYLSREFLELLARDYYHLA